ncbi:hypothetical protein ATY76_04360 [Rhizobium sp. R339]|uniref:hypothetical protein n=1 Tax=Rhizobium sp. R339 TaxID=1764273 RepID=UPI000B52C71D|nr:hypothetical protein [Rhizobium sp. R339]OWV77184.1 hypothetical protein ATY76_04360 [Rhizobium sp. R339]
MSISFKQLAAVAVIGLAVVPGIAQAESFSKLAGQNYAVGKLTKSKAGAYGWVVSNGSKQFFCRMDASLAYVSKKEMVSFTTSGRMIKVDRATFEARIGGPDPSIPQWSDLQAGRVKPADVGSCTPVR